MSETREDKVLCLLAREAFRDEHAQSLAQHFEAGLDWKRFVEVARWHRVLPLVHRNLKRSGLGIPPEVAEELEREAEMVRSEIENRMVEMGRLVDDFLSEYPVMLMKGAALDLAVYSERAMTFPCDIDLLVQRDPTTIPDEEQTRIDERLEDLGFIEMSCGEHHDISMNDALAIDYDRVFADSSEIEVSGRKLRIPSPEDMFLFSAINCCRKKFFHLKSLADLDAISSRYPDLDWARLERSARDAGAEHILYAVLHVLKTVMGVAPETTMSLRPGFFRRSVIHGLVRTRSFTSLRELHRRPKRERKKLTRLAALLPYACLHRGQMKLHLRRDLHACKG